MLEFRQSNNWFCEQKMTLLEILTLLVAVIGAITGLTSLLRTRRLAEKQLEFQAISAALAKRQLRDLEQQEDAKSKADITVELVSPMSFGGTRYEFVLSNRGSAPATDVDFRIAESSADDPLIRNECDRKLPYPQLEPGQSFTLTAVLHMGSAMKYATKITWRNLDGSTGSRDVQVAV